MDRRRIQRSRKTARGRSTSRSLSTSFTTDGGTGGRNERRLRGASAKLQTSILLFPVVIEYPKSTRDPWTRYLDHVHWEVEKNVAPTSPSHASRENVWKSGLLDYFERNFLSEREIDEACEKDFYFRFVGGGGSKQRVSFERGKGGFPRLIGGKRLGNER